MEVAREHKRLAGLVGDSLLAIEHFRVVDEFRETEWYGPGYCSVGVVILKDGSCFAQRVRRSRHQYVRRIWHRMAVGQALKRAVLGKLYGEVEPDFVIDVAKAATPRERENLIREALGIFHNKDNKNYFINDIPHYIAY